VSKVVKIEIFCKMFFCKAYATCHIYIVILVQIFLNQLTQPMFLIREARPGVGGAPFCERLCRAKRAGAGDG